MTTTADREERVRTADSAGGAEDPHSMRQTALESRRRPPLPPGPQIPSWAPGEPLRDPAVGAPTRGRPPHAPCFGLPEVLS